MNSYTIKIEGKRIYRFLDTLVRQRIPFHKLNEENNFCVLEVTMEDFERIKKLHTTYQITVVKRRGLPYILYLWKKKKIFLGSVLFAFFLLTFFSYIIFDIQVIHTDKQLRDIIYADLKECGLEKYHFKINYETKEKIRNKILEKEKEIIEWLEIEEIGTTYQVKVIPRVQKKEEEALKPRSVVAKKSGMILSIEATTGEVVVQKNQYVEKGQELITGIIKNKEEVKALVPATGKVYAEVWYQVNMVLPLKYEEEERTGKEKKVFEIHFLNNDFSLFDFSPYAVSHRKEQVLWKHPLLPFQVTYTKKEEVQVKRIAYDEGNLLEKVEPLAFSKLKEQLGEDISILDRKVLKKSSKLGKIEIELFFKVKEDITEYRMIDENSISSSQGEES